MASNLVAGFRPTTSGFHFANSFPKLPLPVRVAGLPRLKLGDASGGLCGGMVFAARDCFEASFPIPTVSSPPQEEDDPLFRYLAQRLYDSLNVPVGVLKYYQWMSWPDADHLGIKGVRSLTIENEWPAVQAALGDGKPVPIGLIIAKSLNPRDLRQNHQVLAYGYDLDDGSGNLTIRVYDPNCPDQDDVVLSLNVRQPGALAYSTGQTVRGFFQTPYAPVDVKANLAGGD